MAAFDKHVQTGPQTGDDGVVPPSNARAALPVIVGVAVLLAVVLAGPLPWRSSGPSGLDSLLEVARRGPLVLVFYVIAVSATAASLVVSVVRPRARFATLVLAGIALVAALGAFVAVPLPSIRVYGSTPDATFVHFEVPSVRSWGGYVVLSATAVLFGARVWAARRSQS